MLERSLARGWRVVLRCGSEAGMAGLDAMLWTYRDDAFLPHGTPAGPAPALQPVYLTLGDENPNGANVLMLVDGARAEVGEMAGFERTCLIFDGQDERAVEAARADWRSVRAAGAAGQVLGAGAGALGAEGLSRQRHGGIRLCTKHARVMHKSCTDAGRRRRRGQFLSTMQSPPAARSRVQSASASARLLRPTCATCSPGGSPGRRPLV